ncbi:unnamed protein product [Ectocarpus sp. 12 AP-2014]
MEPACTEAGKTLNRGVKPTTPTARDPTGKVRRRSSEVVPRRGLPKTLGRNKSCVDVGETGVPMAGSNAGSSAVRARRGSLSMLANQLRLLEEEKAGAARVRSKDSEQQHIQHVLDSALFLGFTTVASTVALLLAVLRTASWQKWQESDWVWVAQLLLAAAAALELVLRLYACGPSYFSYWVHLCDAFVIVGGGCLTVSVRVGSAVLFLRTVRIAALRLGNLAPGRSEPQQVSTNPAVQLYQLVNRVVRDSSGLFTAAEKRALRRLLSLLAHKQIYVDATLQRGNEAYWKEYGQDEDRARGRSSFAVGVEADPGISPSGFWVSPPLSPPLPASSSSEETTASHMIGVAMAIGGGGVAKPTMGSIQDNAVRAVLAKVDQWDFDPFELEEVTQGHPLVTLSGYLFAVKHNLFSCFAFSKPHFNNFMVKVEQGYGSGKGAGVTNVYHSRRHAADVTQAVHYFLKVCNLGQHLQDVEVAALLLGSLIHDFKHPGRSNAFLTRTGHKLAITYNDVSVLENYHLSEAFFLLREDECNFFRDLVPATAQEIRHIMVSMVLATDLKEHFDVLGEFNSHLADVREGVLVNEGRSKTYACAMKVCIKSADISHPARVTDLHLRWTRDVIEEFFLQGDEEKSLGLEPSPLCDRHNTDIASSQKNFISFLVNPLFESWVSFLDCPAADLCTKNLKRNEAMWVAREKAGDNSFDFATWPAATQTTPPPPPPPALPVNVNAYSSSMVNAMNLPQGGGNFAPSEAGVDGSFGDGDGGDERIDQDDDTRQRAAMAAVGVDLISSSGAQTGTNNLYRALEEGVAGGGEEKERASEARSRSGVGLRGVEGSSDGLDLSSRSGATTTTAEEAGAVAPVAANWGPTTPRNAYESNGSSCGSAGSSPNRRRSTSTLERIFPPSGGPTPPLGSSS